MPSGHDDLGTTPLVPESMIDRMCQRDLMSNDDHADHHSHACGIRIVADTAEFSHPLSLRGRVAVVGLATNHQPKPGLEVDQGKPGRCVEPAT
jgi:hypothetical protein